MTREKAILILCGTLLVLFVLKVLSMMLGVSMSLYAVVRVFAIFIVLPVLFATVLVRPVLAGRILFVVLVLDLQYFFGMTSVSTVYLYYCVCAAAHLVRVLFRKEPLFPPGMAALPWLAYVAIAVAHYARDPALPTFGVGSGSGFRAYFQFFAGFVPYLILPACFDRATLVAFPRYFLGVSLVATLVRLIAVWIPDERIQSLLFTTPQMLYLVEGRFSLLTLSSTCLFVAASTLLFLEPRDRPGPRPVWYILALGIGGVGLLLTGTRALAMAAAGTLLYIMLIKRWWLQTAMAVGLLAVAILYVANIRVSQSSPLAPVVRALSVKVMGQNTYSMADNPYLSSETLEWRKMLWGRALESIREHKWLGRGFSGRYSEYVQRNVTYYASRLYTVTEGELDAGATHNLFLAPFLSFGIPAGLLFAWYVIQRTRHTVRLALHMAIGHDLHVTVHLLAVWLVFTLISGILSGGTVATTLFLALALTHVVDRYLLVEAEVESADTDVSEAPPLAPPSPV